MTLYFDSAYIAKCYLNEPDGKKVRRLAYNSTGLSSSVWCLAEFGCVLHRHLREGSIQGNAANSIWDLFLRDIKKGVWNLLPVPERILRIAVERVLAAPVGVLLRAGDAIHLATAQDGGFTEIWSNDKRLLAAAPHFQLTGKSV